MRNNKREKQLKTILIVIGILIAYVMQMAPSPILLSVKEYYKIGSSEALLNLSVSVIYPAIIAASLIGVALQKKCGTYHLFTFTLVFLLAGALLNFTANSYFVFLAARFLYGVGFGLGIPFIGSAIMIWYEGKERDVMNTINGLFPFFGASISFCVMDSLRIALDGSVKASMGIWGIGFLIVGLIWVLRSKEIHIDKTAADAEVPPEYNIYKKILGFKEIRLLCIIFMCDFFCYSYLSVILPTMLYESGNGRLSEGAAGLLAAVAFPIIGVIGCLCGGVLSGRSGRKAQVIFIGQFLKFISLFVIWFLRTSVPGIIAGTVLFGFGNGFWMPAMYAMPMDIKELNASDVGGVFAFVSSCGFVCGFISPVLGGALTDAFVPMFGSGAAGHVSALALGLLIFNVVDLLSVICALLLHKPGTKAS